MNRKSLTTQKKGKALFYTDEYGDAHFYKKPSLTQKKDTNRKERNTKQKRWDNKYDEQEKQMFKFGIFNKKGFVMIRGFATKEEAEQSLSKYGKLSVRFEIRELLW